MHFAYLSIDNFSWLEIINYIIKLRVIDRLTKIFQSTTNVSKLFF